MPPPPPKDAWGSRAAASVQGGSPSAPKGPSLTVVQAQQAGEQEARAKLESLLDMVRAPPATCRPPHSPAAQPSG
eukprot:1810880-Prymnesium_polylepis.1